MMRYIKKISVTMMTMICALIMVQGYSKEITYLNETNPSLIPNAQSGKMSFYFQNIEIRALLQLIAKNSGLNFIISDAVKGNVTLNLQNVTWDQALKVIMQSHGLSSKRVGNVLYISTLEELTTNESKELQATQALINLEPLQSQLIHLKYAIAEDVANIFKGKSNLLTARGEIGVDARTNSIIVRDIKQSIREIEKQIRALDIPARQVLIEARIVNIDTTYEQNLGVRFGLSNSRHLSGTFAGASNINSGVSPSALEDPLQRLNFNLPARQLTDGSNPGSIALALAHLGPVLLDLELSALEGENHAKIISRPRVVTSNQKKASIEVGEEIPYQEASSSGATSVTFKKAVLSLEIVPQITPDNKIVLNIKATQDAAGRSIQTGQSATTGSTTIPVINTEAVQSSVLLNDKETIVLGGVYRQNKTNTLDRIPFFGSLPVFGMFFRNTTVHDDKRELLIFITPKIIHPLSQSVHTTVFKEDVVS